jgi:excisionase family DNA binding protein
MKPETIETPVGRIVAGLAPQDCAGLPINAAADYLGIGRSSVYNLLAEGLIKSVQIRGRRIVLRASLDDYLKKLSS